MNEKHSYQPPRIAVIDVYGEEMMQDFVPYSETEVVDLPIDDNPNDGIRPEDALGKETSVWDE
ncbi:MAG: hypothetical protein IKX24_07680 [Prevotella sp.]|nr:hypothetical protein [Prevotella sp.]